MEAEKLAERLDRARWVRYHPSGLVLAWFEGHGIHVYDLGGSEVHYFSAGDFKDNEATLEEVQEAMEDYIAGDHDEEGDE